MNYFTFFHHGTVKVCLVTSDGLFLFKCALLGQNILYYLEKYNCTLERGLAEFLSRISLRQPLSHRNQQVISCPSRPGHSPRVHRMLRNVDSAGKVVRTSFHDESVSWAALNSAPLFTPQEGKSERCSPSRDRERNDTLILVEMRCIILLVLCKLCFESKLLLWI